MVSVPGGREPLPTASGNEGGRSPAWEPELMDTRITQLTGEYLLAPELAPFPSNPLDDESEAARQTPEEAPLPTNRSPGCPTALVPELSSTNREILRANYHRLPAHAYLTLKKYINRKEKGEWRLAEELD